MTRRALVLVLVAVLAACGDDSGDDDSASTDDLRTVLDESGWLAEHPGTDFDMVLETAASTCAQFERDPRWQQNLVAGGDVDGAEYALLLAQGWCPDHVAAAEEAIEDLGS